MNCKLCYWILEESMIWLGTGERPICTTQKTNHFLRALHSAPLFGLSLHSPVINPCMSITEFWTFGIWLYPWHPIECTFPQSISKVFVWSFAGTRINYFCWDEINMFKIQSHSYKYGAYLWRAHLQDEYFHCMQIYESFKCYKVHPCDHFELVIIPTSWRDLGPSKRLYSVNIYYHYFVFNKCK